MSTCKYLKIKMARYGERFATGPYCDAYKRPIRLNPKSECRDCPDKEES